MQTAAPSAEVSTVAQPGAAATGPVTAAELANAALLTFKVRLHACVVELAWSLTSGWDAAQKAGLRQP